MAAETVSTYQRRKSPGGAGLGLGMLLNSLIDLPVGGRPASAVAGAVITAAGLALSGAGIAGVIRHRTTIVPHHSVATLVSDWAYRWSRNPPRPPLALAAERSRSGSREEFWRWRRLS